MWAWAVGKLDCACDHILERHRDGRAGPWPGQRQGRSWRWPWRGLGARFALRKQYDAGLDWVDASEEIIADFFNHWIDRERVFINVNTLYREFDKDAKPPAAMKVFAEMAKWYWSEYPDRHPHGNCGDTGDRGIEHHRTVKQMVADANKYVEEISITDARDLVGRDDVLFIDIRDIREVAKTGRVSGARRACAAC